SAIREYIDWYNNKRIKTKLHGLSPVEYRLQAV
ncbi:MAG: IS3 family transposase, partial [Ezakiella sp.]